MSNKEQRMLMLRGEKKRGMGGGCACWLLVIFWLIFESIFELING